jgi:translation initiation factor 4E
LGIVFFFIIIILISFYFPFVRSFVLFGNFYRSSSPFHVKKGMAANPTNEEGMKHPLQRSWTLWYDEGVRRASGPARGNLQNNWEDNLKEVLSVSTVEDFWGLINNVVNASALHAGSNYHFFETGVKPAWEDQRNSQGGKWTVVFKKRSVDLDKKWLFSLLACIGESFPGTEQICGLVVSIRNNPGDRIALWTSNADDKDTVLAIGKYFKERVLECDVKVSYVSHQESQRLRNYSRHEI